MLTTVDRPPAHARAVLVFSVSGRMAAFPAEEVERVVLVPELSRPPGLPAAIEGILNLSGQAVPVLRVDRLLGLTEQSIGLYSMILIVRAAVGRFAILVDPGSRLVLIPAGSRLPVDGGDCFNACAEATVNIEGDPVPVLSATRMLLEKEKQMLAEFQQAAQRRLGDWGIR
jgi:purine-binding chemotaxis protein CheW